MVRRFCILLVLLMLLPFGVCASVRGYADSSALSDGRFVKISVEESGVYSISFQQLYKMGFINPERVKLYGYGGELISERFSEQPCDDLPEVPLWRTDNALLFYARGTVGWQQAGSKFVRTRNCYSDKAYYFLTEADEESASDFPVAKQVSSPSATTITTFNEHILYEKDGFSWLGSGRELYDSYDFASGNSRSYSISTKDAAEANATVTVAFAAYSSKETTLAVTADSKSLGTMTIGAYGGDYYVKAVEKQEDFSIADAIGNTTTIRLTHNRTYGVAGHLNYITVNYKRRLTLDEPYLCFRSTEATGQEATFVIDGADSSTVVWDITEPDNYKQVTGTLSDGKYTFTIAASNTLHEFVVVNTAADFSSPESVGEVANQNLHAMEATDLIIIVPNRTDLMRQAERLAQLHRGKEGLTVQVITSEQIYNEFSSGTPDATAYRRLMKMLYDKYSDEAARPKYLLLFGDCAYDNRMLTTAWKGEKLADYLLSYQLAESNDEKMSQLTDDYFGMLDDEEGYSPATDRVDIGIGRIPVRTESEAKAVVDKITAYTSNSAAGEWKRTVVFAADDAEGSKSDNSFMLHAIELADSLKSYSPQYKAELLLEDSYKRESSSTGFTYPEAKSRLQQLLSNGALMLNYTGHSETDSWTEEGLLTADDIKSLKSERLALWFSASCEFGRFDAKDNSGAELALLNANGGAIGVIATSRVVYDSPNFTLHSAVLSEIFNSGSRERLRLGDIIRRAKQVNNALLNDRNKINFNLIGDPALTLATPEYNIRVTEIDGIEITDVVTDNELPNIKAGDKITIRGEVADDSAGRQENFNGTLNLLLLDSEESVSTLDNAGKGAVSYRDNLRTLANSTDSVRNGTFEVTIAIPMDINYSDLNGMMKLYALSSDKREAAGAFSSFLVGGTSDNVADDGEGPAMNIYLNTPDFRDGDVVNSTPYFVAELSDSNGINTSGSGIGHDLTLIVDDETTYTLNDYYTPEAGDYTRGRVAFSIPELSDGSHTLTFRAWDTMNNSSTQTLTFEVADGQRPSIASLRASISPARTSTTFIVEHNRPMTAMSVRITVRDTNGNIVWYRSESGAVDEGCYRIEWDLTDTRGRRVSPGIYIFSAEIATSSSKTRTKSEKIAILAQ